jgi:hypothetical protein
MSQQPFQASAPENVPATSLSARNLIASRKQDFNIYTVMLLLSFVFLLVGTVLMVFELNRYEGGLTGAWKTSTATPVNVGQ